MNTSSERTILVTGASGFLGTHAVPYLKKFFKVQTLSLKQDQAINNYLFTGIDVVVYLTGIAHQAKKFDSTLYYTVNRDMAVMLANKAKASGASQFVYISSIKAIGEGGKGIHKEGAECHPLSDYGKSKLQAEEELMKLNDPQYVVSVIRPAVVYGKGAKGNIDKLMRLIDKFPVIPLGGIDNQRSMVYVGNFLALLKSVIDNAMPGIFIAADNEAKSTSDMVNEINNSRGNRKKIIRMPKVMMEVIKTLLPGMHKKLFDDFVVDNSSTNQRLNFTPPFTFETGIREMMEEETTQNKR